MKAAFAVVLTLWSTGHFAEGGRPSRTSSSPARPTRSIALGVSKLDRAFGLGKADRTLPANGGWFESEAVCAHQA